MKHLMKKAVKVAVFAALTTLALTAFASAEGEMAIGAGCTTGTSLRMRSEPNTSSAIVTTLNKSVAVALLDDSVPGWYKINYNGSTGYVSSDYLIIDQDNIFTTYGRVPEGTVNVRAAATTESESLATIDAGTVVTVNGLVNGWYDVPCQYGTEGYVRSDLLVLTSNATSGKGSSIVETALSHLGTRYVYGGASAGGFDASIRFSHLGKRCVSSAVHEKNLAFAQTLTPKDILIVLSASGQSARLEEVSAVAKGRDVPVLVITCDSHGPLAQLADYVMTASNREQRLIEGSHAASLLSPNVLIEVLYYLLRMENL